MCRVLNLNSNPLLTGALPDVWLPSKLLWLSTLGTGLVACTNEAPAGSSSCTLPVSENVFPEATFLHIILLLGCSFENLLNGTVPLGGTLMVKGQR